jgi:lipopolysaccharide export system ATP-binding protein
MTSVSTPHIATHDLLEARSLCWYHAGRRIVDGVDLVVRSGEIVGLLGPNGAGKTVTLSMIVGLLKPTSGHILIGGKEITDLPLHERARRGLGYLPQERSVFTKLNAHDNIAAILEARGMSGRASSRRADELLAQFALSHVARTRASQLSGGEQRRLEVARSLASAPHFLLFDEPFAGIDPLTIESLHTILVTLRNTGVGILLTDHNVQETLGLCDRAYVLLDGRVLAEGSPSELTENDNVRQYFLGAEFELFAAAGR